MTAAEQALIFKNMPKRVRNLTNGHIWAVTIGMPVSGSVFELVDFSSDIQELLHGFYQHVASLVGHPGRGNLKACFVSNMGRLKLKSANNVNVAYLVLLPMNKIDNNRLEHLNL